MPHELDSLIESGQYTLFATMEDMDIKLTDDQLNRLCTVVANMIKEVIPNR